MKWQVETMEMEKSKAGSCIFRKMVDNQVSLMVGVHVDGIIVSGEKGVCVALFDELKERFPDKHQEVLKIYTGFAFVQDWESGVLEMNQTEFAENLIAQNLVYATSNVPGSRGVDLGHKKESEPGDKEEFPRYRPLVRSLITRPIMTRPDITNTLRACSRYSHNLSPRHWKALLQVAVYVNGAKEICWKFICSSGLGLSVFADADYAATSVDRRSMSGVAVILGDTAESWKSSTQKCVTTVACEAEDVA